MALHRTLPILCAMAVCARAQSPAAPGLADVPMIAATTTHAVTTASGRIAYHATVDEFVLTDTTGLPRATLFSTTYIRDGVSDATSRPVLFAFNGGPGASSSPLHLGAIGPVKRAPVADANGERPLSENAVTLLDDADLVFIDPVGTGFSRVLPGADGGAYFTPSGDAKAVLRFISAWLGTHGRRNSPVYIAGESYGGFRLATMLHDVGPLKLAGVILISPMLDATSSTESAGNDTPYIFTLPAMAIAAWYHGRGMQVAGGVTEVFARASAFAQGDYALALLHGTRLGATDRATVAARMHELIGVPVERILAADLRIATDSFVTLLLRDKGVRIGRLDTRATGAEKEFGPRRPPMNDPSMTMTTGSANSLNAYFHDSLGARTPRDYVSLAMNVNAGWKWAPDAGDDEFYHNPTPNIGAVMRAQPALRVLLIGGYYDLAVPLLASQYALDHGGVPPERVTLSIQDGGHSMYETDASRATFALALRDFIGASARP